MQYIYIYTCALAKPGFCSGGRISCKPKNGALLSTSAHQNDTRRRLSIVHCLVPVPIATMITKVLVPDEYTNIITSNNNSNIQNTITYKCDNDSNNGVNHNNMIRK